MAADPLPFTVLPPTEIGNAMTIMKQKIELYLALSRKHPDKRYSVGCVTTDGSTTMHVFIKNGRADVVMGKKQSVADVKKNS